MSDEPKTTHISEISKSLDRCLTLRDGLDQEVARCERELLALRNKLAGVEMAIAVVGEDNENGQTENDAYQSSGAVAKHNCSRKYT